MFCPNCGANLADDTKFCGRCGHKIDGVPAPQAVEEQPVQEPVPVAEEEAAQNTFPSVESPDENATVVLENGGVQQPYTQSAYTAPQPVAASVYTPPVAEPQPTPAEPSASQSYAFPEGYTPAAEMPSQNDGKPVGKLKYIASHAPGKVKAMSWVSWIACVLCIVLVGLSGFLAVANPIVELPVIEMAASMSEDVDESVDELKKTLDEAEDTLDNLEVEYEKEKDSLTSKQQAVAEELLEWKDEFNADLSLMGLFRAADVLLDIAEVELDKEFDLNDIDEVQEVKAAFDMVFMASIICFAVLALLLILAALFKLNTLTVLSMIFTLPILFVLGGILFTVIVFALYIVLIVAHCIINSNYRKYRRQVRGMM